MITRRKEIPDINPIRKSTALLSPLNQSDLLQLQKATLNLPLGQMKILCEFRHRVNDIHMTICVQPAVFGEELIRSNNSPYSILDGLDRSEK